MRSRVTLSSLALAATLAIAPTAQAQFTSPVHVVPVVVKAAGVAGTDWRSDLAVSNLGDGTGTVGFAYFPEKRDNTFNFTFPVTLTLGPGETRSIQDVIGTLFPSYGSNTKGVLAVALTSGGGDYPRLAVTSRAYNAADPDATYGQTVPSSFIGWVSGQGVSVLTGVQQDSRARTNIGVLNASARLLPIPGFIRTKVRIRIYGDSGALLYDGVKEVEALSLRQWNLEKDFGVSGLSAGRVEVSVDPFTEGYDPCKVNYSIGGEGALIMAYYSKVDNATGDAEFGIGQVDWSLHTENCGQDPTEGCGDEGAS